MNGGVVRGDVPTVVVHGKGEYVQSPPAPSNSNMVMDGVVKISDGTILRTNPNDQRLPRDLQIASNPDWYTQSY